MSEAGKYLERKLKRFGIHISGKTGDGTGRGKEIKEWLDRNAAGLLEGWCVIDSEAAADCEEEGAMPRVGKTCALSGLTEMDAEKAVRVMNGA